MMNYCKTCEQGLVREINQDSIFVYNDTELNRGLFVVADGMGGYEDGEMASREIVDVFEKTVEEFPEGDGVDFYWKRVDLLKKALMNANLSIFEKYNSGRICGSTCVALYIEENFYTIISVGDSRIYRMDGFSLKQVTRDDVWETKYEIASSLTAEQQQENDSYGKLTKAVGVKQELIPTIMSGELKKNCSFLLCSDGLYKMCRKKDLARSMFMLSEKNRERKMKKLIDLVYKNGASDNLSAILLYWKKDT